MSVRRGSSSRQHCRLLRLAGAGSLPIPPSSCSRSKPNTQGVTVSAGLTMHRPAIRTQPETDTDQCHTAERLAELQARLQAAQEGGQAQQQRLSQQVQQLLSLQGQGDQAAEQLQAAHAQLGRERATLQAELQRERAALQVPLSLCRGHPSVFVLQLLSIVAGLGIGSSGPLSAHTRGVATCSSSALSCPCHDSNNPLCPGGPGSRAAALLCSRGGAAQQPGRAQLPRGALAGLPGEAVPCTLLSRKRR